MKKTESRKTKQEGKKKNEASSGPLREVVLQIANTLFHNAVEKVQVAIKTRLNELLQELKKFVAAFFLIVAGVLFVLVGMASLVDHLAGIRGVGFIFIGFILAMMGVFFNIAGKSRK